jgi:2-oxoglutarate dehydrogenase E2 component (dihydrolipoamide succinyltransferase)
MLSYVIDINGKVEINLMMYVVLSDDHRSIDGRESVGFLVAVKEAL